MFDLNGMKIENLFSVNTNFNGNKKPYLEYKVICLPCFPENIECTYQNDFYKADEIKLFLDKLRENYLTDKLKLTSLNLYEIKITNIGNDTLKGQDFFKNSKLRVKLCDFYAGFINTYHTKDYINAKIAKYEDYTYYIEFDSLKPNDSIVISFISDKIGYESFVEVFGETSYFEKPINPENVISLNTTKHIINSIVMGTIYTIVSILFFVLLSIAIYCKIENKTPVFKVQFKIEEAQKVNAK